MQNKIRSEIQSGSRARVVPNVPLEVLAASSGSMSRRSSESSDGSNSNMGLPDQPESLVAMAHLADMISMNPGKNFCAALRLIFFSLNYCRRHHDGSIKPDQRGAAHDDHEQPDPAPRIEQRVGVLLLPWQFWQLGRPAPAFLTRTLKKLFIRIDVFLLFISEQSQNVLMLPIPSPTPPPPPQLSQALTFSQERDLLDLLTAPSLKRSYSEDHDGLQPSKHRRSVGGDKENVAHQF